MSTIKAIKFFNYKSIYSNLQNNSLMKNDYQKLSPQIIIRCVRSPFMYRDKRALRVKKDFFVIPAESPTDERVEKLRTSFGKTILPKDLAEMRFAFPEFLPTPNWEHRNPIMEKIFRIDMLKRRTHIEIPEFYVGSILAVTISDPFSPGKVSRFLGICIERKGQGLYHNFTLRNRIDNQGVEIRYDMYNPTIREIQVIKLEKRVDDHLLYLRDALPEYSYFPQDMAPEPRKAGEPIPVNTIKVEMKKWPWSIRWETHHDLRGIGPLIDLPDWQYLRGWPRFNQYDKFDLMKQYRETATEDELLEMMEQIKEHQQNVSEIRKAERRKKLLQTSDKTVDTK